MKQTNPPSREEEWHSWPSLALLATLAMLAMFSPPKMAKGANTTKSTYLRKLAILPAGVLATQGTPPEYFFRIQNHPSRLLTARRLKSTRAPARFKAALNSNGPPFAFFSLTMVYHMVPLWVNLSKKMHFLRVGDH